jgi:hypothetical protein
MQKKNSRRRRETTQRWEERKPSTGQKDFSLVSTACLKAIEPRVFFLESGATEHITDQLSNFTSLRNIEPGT